ncbi:MAG: gliding motility-associated C-terminal domain-containing protein [Chitinophagales bacterium]
MDLGSDTSLCAGELLILDAGSGFDSYLWSDNSNGQGLFVNQSGLYWVEVDSAGIIERDSIEVIFYSNPVSSFEVDTVCLNTELPILNFSFGNPDTITEYLWDFGNGDIDSVELPEYIYPNAGAFDIGLKVSNQFGCTDSSGASVLIHDLPAVDIGFSADTLNRGDTLVINPVQGGSMAQWTPTDRVSDPTNDTTLLYPINSINYLLSVTNSNGCVGTAELSLLVNTFPNANNDLVSVDPESATTIDVLANDNDSEGGITDLSIEDGPFHGNAFVQGDSIIVYTSDPSYAGYDTILYRICDFGKPPLCDFAQLIILVRNTSPVAEPDLGNGENGLPIEIDVLTNDSDVNIAQTIEITFISNPPNGTVENRGDGILVYTSDLDFSGTDEFFYLLCDDGIPVLCDTGFVSVNINLSPVNVVNSFSPNGDGVYDFFTVEGIRNFPENKLLIFSRWGDVIFEKNGYNNDWDGGRGFSEEVPEGVYYYQLDLNDGSDPLKGYLYLKR